MHRWFAAWLRWSIYRIRLMRCALLADQTTSTGVATIPNWNENVKVLIRRPRWVVILIQAVMGWNMYWMEFEIQLFVLLRVINGLVGSYVRRAYWWVRTLRQLLFMTGAEDSVHINFDWSACFQLIRKAPISSRWWLRLCGGRYPDPVIHSIRKPGQTIKDIKEIV